MTCEKIRDFEQQIGEDVNTYQWSHDGKFIAKIYHKHEEIEKTEAQKAEEQK